MKFLGLFSIFLLAVFTISAQTPIDTIVAENGERMVIYSDRSWTYLKDVGFDGVMNPTLQKYLASKNFDKVQTWCNDRCFTSSDHYGLGSITDTLALDLGEAEAFTMPVPGVVTSRYGYRKYRYHQGIDLNLNTGDSVVSAWSGKVRYAQYNSGGYGNLVVIRHKNGLETFYAHLSKIIVSPNDEVKAGDIIGLGGNTGRSFGAHLHFEVRFFDAPINPEEIIDFEARKLKKCDLLVHKGILRPGAKPSDIMDEHDHDHGQSVASVAKAPTKTTGSYYKIRQGDTLSKIAARNNTTISRLCQLNGIRQTTVLQVGRTLRVR